MDYSLTPNQKKAFAKLQKAFIECQKAGIYIFDNYGELSAINGKVVSLVAADDSLADELDSSMVSCIDELIDTNADDQLYVAYHVRG